MPTPRAETTAQLHLTHAQLAVHATCPPEAIRAEEWRTDTEDELQTSTYTNADTVSGTAHTLQAMDMPITDHFPNEHAPSDSDNTTVGAISTNAPSPQFSETTEMDTREPEQKESKESSTPIYPTLNNASAYSLDEEDSEIRVCQLTRIYDQVLT
jgi:hypothetical protein